MSIVHCPLSIINYSLVRRANANRVHRANAVVADFAVGEIGNADGVYRAHHAAAAASGGGVGGNADGVSRARYAAAAGVGGNADGAGCANAAARNGAGCRRRRAARRLPCGAYRVRVRAYGSGHTANGVVAAAAAAADAYPRRCARRPRNGGEACRASAAIVKNGANRSVAANSLRSCTVRIAARERGGLVCRNRQRFGSANAAAVVGRNAHRTARRTRVYLNAVAVLPRRYCPA